MTTTFDRESCIAEGVAQLKEEHANWVVVWKHGDIAGWKKVLLAAQQIWKHTERTCQIYRIELEKRVNRATTRGGRELWNPHHYVLDSFMRKNPPPVQGGSQPHRLSRTSGPSQSDKRLFDEMAWTYDKLEDNLGALRQIASKKLRR